MSDDLQHIIATLVARNYLVVGDGDIRFKADSLAADILDGGIAVRPGVRIMAVEEDHMSGVMWACSSRCMTEGGPHDGLCRKVGKRLYREATK